MDYAHRSSESCESYAAITSKQRVRIILGEKDSSGDDVGGAEYDGVDVDRAEESRYCVRAWRIK
jgi:hypothetical protein